MIKINGEIAEKMKGKIKCNECNRQMHSRRTDGSGRKKAVKIIDKGDHKIKIYEMICPHSHTKFVWKKENKHVGQ